MSSYLLNRFYYNVTWIRRLLIKNSEWSNKLTETTLCKITQLFQYGVDSPRQKPHLLDINTFWKETVLIFAEFINIDQHKNTQTLFEPLWYNDKIH